MTNRVLAFFVILLIAAVAAAQSSAEADVADPKVRQRLFADVFKGSSGDDWVEAVADHLREPDVVRFVVAGLRHKTPAVRRSCLNLATRLRIPYVERHRLRAFARESDATVLADHVRSLSRQRASPEAWATWLRRWDAASREERVVLEPAILFLAMGGSPHSAFSPVWPSAGRGGGWKTDRQNAPFRTPRGAAFDFNAPLAQNPVRLMLAYRGLAQPSKAEVFVDDRSLGHWDLAPVAADDIGGASMTLNKPVDLRGKVLDIRLAHDPRFKLQIRGIAAVMPGFFKGRSSWTAVEVGGGVKPGDGAVPEAAGVPHVRLTGDQAEVSFEITGSVTDIERLELDHWSDDPKGAGWDVALNGQRLVRLISQPLPRPARASFRLARPKVGKNTLTFHRLRGGDLRLEAVHLYRRPPR